jgi:hypothetical protein
MMDGNACADELTNYMKKNEKSSFTTARRRVRSPFSLRDTKAHQMGLNLSLNLMKVAMAG